ncbi:hypothetical protein X777_12010 [Ooceraea biroi]|uniref:Uncharacterized protein n=1 Tax=Ooceraea biroi TaxID=2015173 RepID=A0A026WZN6_OOCBI|nr:hypothetical protein X777_12010 [Ooceraea biroi]
MWKVFESNFYRVILSERRKAFDLSEDTSARDRSQEPEDQRHVSTEAFDKFEDTD